MATYNASSTNQSGGVTAGRVKISGSRKPSSNRKKRFWAAVGAVALVVTILAGLADILGYMSISPERPKITVDEKKEIGGSVSVNGQNQTVNISPERPTTETDNQADGLAKSPARIARGAEAHERESAPLLPKNMTEEKKRLGDSYNVRSQNQTGGITAGQINIGPPQRHVDEDGEAWLLANVPRSGPPVEITAMMNDRESYTFAREIESFLRAKGYNVRGIGQKTFQPPAVGVFVDPRSEWTHLVVGHQR